MVKSDTLPKLISEESKVGQADCKKVLVALGKVVARETQLRGSCKIPDVVVVSKLNTPAKAERIKNLFGKLTNVAAKLSSFRLRFVATKQLKDAILSVQERE